MKRPRLGYGLAIAFSLAVWAALAHSCSAQPADLVRVNDEVNRSIRYRSDLDQYGRPDYWVGSPASNEGDCEDYALTKYDRLGRGRVVVVGWQNERIHRLRGFHAVLVIDGWVLDNIERQVVTVETARRYYTGL
jgi:predicted transglutaminase-like cysteine proteinase